MAGSGTGPVRVAGRIYHARMPGSCLFRCFDSMQDLLVSMGGGKPLHREKTGYSWPPEMSSHSRSGASDGAFASFMLASIAAVRLPCVYSLWLHFTTLAKHIDASFPV